MRNLFLILGLLLLVASASQGFLQPWGPTPGEVLAMIFLIGGFVLLGIGQVLKSLDDLKSKTS